MNFDGTKPKRFGNLITISKKELQDFIKNQTPIVKKGFDLELIKKVTKSVTIPVIAHGGAANVSHISASIKDSGADAVAIASMLHYAELNRNGSLVSDYNTEGNTEFLKKKVSFKMFGKENISEIKVQLNKYDIPLRIVD